jgi:hypothetical protein
MLSTVICTRCGHEFLKKNSEINRTKTNFCSSDCFKNYRISHKKVIEKFCKNCGEKLNLSSLNSRNNFCSQKCATSYNNKARHKIQEKIFYEK